MLTNLKQGDVLIDKDGGKIKILEVLGQLYFPSMTNDFKKANGIGFTIEELEDYGYTLEPQKLEKWVPEIWDAYYYMEENYGDAESISWNNSEIDLFRLSIGNVHKTMEDVQKYKEDLQKWAEGRE